MIKRRLFAISLLFNFLFVSLAGYTFYKKGGLSYITSKVYKVSSENKINQLLNYPYRLDRISLFDNLSEKKNSIIFLGDSITDGCEWSELLNNSNIVNRGINSDTTYGVLERVHQIVKLNPEKVFLMIGTNDLREGRTIADIRNDYEKIVKEFSEKIPSARIYVQSVIPSSQDKYPGRSQQRIHDLNKEIRELAVKYHLTYIDLYTEMLSDDGKLDPNLTNDGLHLNGNGYIVWKNIIKDYL